jgi:hypothetical protein
MADPYIDDHQRWIDYLQPDGLVVSAAAFIEGNATLPREGPDLTSRFETHLGKIASTDGADALAITDLAAFLIGFLEWPPELLLGHGSVVPDALEVPLPELGEVLRPTFAFVDARPADAERPWLLLVQSLPMATDLDVAHADDARGWFVSPTRRFERLLRETRVPVGLMANGTHLRLVYAPRGENTGTLTFPVAAMVETAGRPILAAFRLLMRRSRLLAGPVGERLPALLARSREYQASVSGRLALQVLDALHELVRGFQSAHKASGGRLLASVLERDPDEVYAGLLNVLMRLVFLLYAEDRGLMPASSVYVQHYSVHGLFQKLRTDAERYPDTMDHRYGAWARLLALFRAVHGGCRHADLAMPGRQGYLFDPARFPFLEGGDTGALPLVADGVVERVLRRLLVLDAERLSYRTLDVEQIGSVYETMMGFRLELATGPTIALRGTAGHGAAVAVDLAQLVARAPAERIRWLADEAGLKADARLATTIRAADSVDALLAAVERRIHRGTTPDVLPAGAMVLQPTDERRRSGSHYTPRALTEPIVQKTLEPVLARLGANPTPAQILDLKVCDPAVGSGAFLVAACRALGDALVRAWHAHDEVPAIPPDEDEVLHARRLVAQRCLYGVDRNPMAADLAKLSLWLATLARDHPFTFLDHAIRAGDSLVGLGRRQIEDFHWSADASAAARQRVHGQHHIARRLESATAARREILYAGDDLPPDLKARKLRAADAALEPVRLAGDLVISAFFAGDSGRNRENRRLELRDRLARHLDTMDFDLAPDAAVAALRGGEWPVAPFHWELEFPEVFDRERPGFDAMVGNPPFLGGRRVRGANGDAYFDWLLQLHEQAAGNADLAAHFFRRAFDLLRRDGTFGLIATNTISQGDTRATGLEWICTHGGTIFAARKRYKWPGQAAVVVSVVWIAKIAAAPTADDARHASDGSLRYSLLRLAPPFDLDGRPVERITAFLFHAGGHSAPKKLAANADRSFIGSYVLGMGFTFDDTDTRGVASPVAEMHRLVARDSRNADRIFPYLGGEEVNSSPTHAHHRYVINFEDMPLRREDLGRTWAGAEPHERDGWLRTGLVPEDYAGPVAADWPDLLAIVDAKVRPERTRRNSNGAFALREPLPTRWWQYADKRPALYSQLARATGALVNSQISAQMVFARVPATTVFSHALNVFVGLSEGGIAVLQSRPHEVWARFFASSMKDDLRYTPSDCFETFPFPDGTDAAAEAALDAAGRAYLDFRADLMVRNNEGLTQTYNRFHDPDETSPDIARLRELHAAMDRAVLDAYGWHDIPTDCEFLLEWEDDEADAGDSRRRKPWRLRWPDAVRDDVLARLLALNEARAAEEARAGAAAALVAAATTPRRRGRPRGGAMGSLL